MGEVLVGVVVEEVVSNFSLLVLFCDVMFVVECVDDVKIYVDLGGFCIIVDNFISNVL